MFFFLLMAVTAIKKKYFTKWYDFSLRILQVFILICFSEIYFKNLKCFF